MAVVGPVFWKELLEAARRKRYVSLRCVIPALFLFAVFIGWMETESHKTSPYYRGTPVLQQQSEMGRAFFACWSVFTALTLGVAAPMLTGGLIAAERERGSLDLLYTTDLSGREIVLGKVVSRVTILWLLLFASAPALLIVAMLGGVAAEHVAGVLIVTLSGAAFVAAVGLYYSTVTKRPWIAIVRTYFFFGMVWFLIPFSVMAAVYTAMHLFGVRYTRAPVETEWFLALDLPFCLANIIEPIFRQRGAPLKYALVNALVSWAAAALFVTLAHWRLRAAPRESVLLRLTLAPFRGLKQLAGWISHPVASRSGRLASAAAARLGWNDSRMEGLLDRQPVAWRNLQASVFDPERYLFKIQRFLAFVLVCFLVFGTMAFGLMHPRDFVGFTILTLIVMHFLIAVLAAGSISRERERGSLELLRTTLLTPGNVLFGNLVGAFRAVRIGLFVFAALMVYAVLFDVFAPPFALAYSAVALIGVLCVAVQGLFISAAAPNVTTAMAAAVGVGFLWWVGPAFIQERDTRTWALGVIAACIPPGVLLLHRKPRWPVFALAGGLAFGAFLFLGLSHPATLVVSAVVCSVAAALGIAQLKSPWPAVRLAAACVCCVTIPLAVGLTGCAILRPDLHRIDNALLYPRFIVDVESEHYYSPDGVHHWGRASRGWTDNLSTLAGTYFFVATAISTWFLYAIAARAFPRLTQSG